MFDICVILIDQNWLNIWKHEVLVREWCGLCDWPCVMLLTNVFIKHDATFTTVRCCRDCIRHQEILSAQSSPVATVGYNVANVPLWAGGSSQGVTRESWGLHLHHWAQCGRGKNSFKIRPRPGPYHALITHRESRPALITVHRGDISHAGEHSTPSLPPSLHHILEQNLSLSSSPQSWTCRVAGCYYCQYYCDDCSQPMTGQVWHPVPSLPLHWWGDQTSQTLASHLSGLE